MYFVLPWLWTQSRPPPSRQLSNDGHKVYKENGIEYSFFFQNALHSLPKVRPDKLISSPLRRFRGKHGRNGGREYCLGVITPSGICNCRHRSWSFAVVPGEVCCWRYSVPRVQPFPFGYSNGNHLVSGNSMSISVTPPSLACEGGGGSKQHAAHVPSHCRAQRSEQWRRKWS